MGDEDFLPNAFERSYTLERTSGEHDPQRIAALFSRIVSHVWLRMRVSVRSGPH
jgi:hypothetical protein